MLGIDISWRSGGSLNAYLLPVIAVCRFAIFYVLKNTYFYYILRLIMIYTNGVKASSTKRYGTYLMQTVMIVISKHF